MSRPLETVDHSKARVILIAQQKVGFRLKRAVRNGKPSASTHKYIPETVVSRLSDTHVPSKNRLAILVVFSHEWVVRNGRPLESTCR